MSSRKNARMRTGAIPMLTMVVVTTFATVVATAGPAAAACSGGTFAPEHNYEVNYGQEFVVSNPGLLTGAEPTGTVLVQIPNGSPSANPTPSDDVSWFDAAVTYPNRQGSFRYKQAAGSEWTGIDMFDYWIIETGCLVDDAEEDFNTVYITVKPVLGNDTYNVVQGSLLTVSAANGVLKNDKGADPTSVTAPTTTAQGGTLDMALEGDGAFTYTPPIGFSGADSFQYTIDDLNFDNSYSATVTINVAANATPPGAPVNLSATPGNGRVDLNWDAANGNGNDIVSYTVTRLSDNKSFDVPGTQTERSMLNLANGTTYTFNVRANSGAGQSSAVSKTATPRTVPGKPTNVKGSVSGSNITVSWSGTNGGASITKSIVTASNGRVAYIAGSTRSARFTGMKPGSYSFTVKSQNVAGTGPSSSKSPSVTVKPSLPTYTAHYTEAEYQYLVKTARHFGLPVSEVGKTGVAVIRFILAISPHPPTRAAARPQNSGPRSTTSTYSVSANASTMVPVSQYLVLNGNDTLKVGAALMQYFAALQGVR